MTDRSPIQRGGVLTSVLTTAAAVVALGLGALVETPVGAAPAQAAAPAAAAQGQPAPAPADAPAGARRGGGRGGPSWAGQVPLNVLVVSGGCCHDYPAQNRIIYDVLNPVAPINWTFELGMTNLSLTQGKLPLYSDPDWASRFDLVIHNECWANGEFPPAFMRSLTLGHDRGIPAVMIHCSLHSYRQSPIDDWRELIGVTSRRHTFAHPIKVTWNQSNPVAKGMPEWTTPTDELYVIEKEWPGMQAVATAVNNQRNEKGVLDNGVKGPNETYPIAWTHLYKGSTRVFGTSLGHANATWDTPEFRELLVRGFRWAMGKDPQVGWTPTPPGMSAPPLPARGGGRGREGGEGRGAAPAPQN
jgi:type 1 glutamine amidotransferase